MKEKNFYQEKRPWGKYTLFVDNKKCSVKIHEIAGQFSLQSHKFREEFWHIISGDALVLKGPLKETLEETKENIQKIYLKPGDNVHIPVGYVHSLKNLGEKPVLILEICKGDYEEDDVVRYEDIYGRV